MLRRSGRLHGDAVILQPVQLWRDSQPITPGRRSASHADHLAGLAVLLPALPRGFDLRFRRNAEAQRRQDGRGETTSAVGHLPALRLPSQRRSQASAIGMVVLQTVGRAYHPVPATVQYMRVDHGRTHVGMAKQLLDAADVIAIRDPGFGSKRSREP